MVSIFGVTDPEVGEHQISQADLLTRGPSGNRPGMDKVGW